MDLPFLDVLPSWDLLVSGLGSLGLEINNNYTSDMWLVASVTSSNFVVDDYV